MRIYTKEEEKIAEYLAKAMVERILEIGDDIFAHLSAGSSISGNDLSHLNREREKEVMGFGGWKVFYTPQMDPKKFTPGNFGVAYVDDTGRTLFFSELREYSDKIPKAIFKSGVKWQEFPSGLIDAAKKTFKDFKHEFDVLFSAEKLPTAHKVAIEEAKESTTARRTAYRVFTTGLKLGRMGTLVPKEEIRALKKVLLGVEA